MADFVDFGHVGAVRQELALQFRAAPFRRHRFTGVCRGPSARFERHWLVGRARVVREEHQRHAADADLAVDDVGAEFPRTADSSSAASPTSRRRVGGRWRRDEPVLARQTQPGAVVDAHDRGGADAVEHVVRPGGVAPGSTMNGAGFRVRVPGEDVVRDARRGSRAHGEGRAGVRSWGLLPISSIVPSPGPRSMAEVAAPLTSRSPGGRGRPGL